MRTPPPLALLGMALAVLVACGDRDAPGQALVSTLVACGLAEDGAVRPRRDDDRLWICIYDCYATLPCDVLETTYCDDDLERPPPPVEECLDLCIEQTFQLTCDDGRRVFDSSICDGFAQCEDGTDEADCPPPFVCDGGDQGLAATRCVRWFERLRRRHRPRPTPPPRTRCHKGG